MTRLQSFIISLLLTLGLLLRLYHLDYPVADWHSHRQADTASVTRIFLQNGIDLLRPRYYDISSTQSGFDNPQGWRMVEFPFYNAAAAIISPIIRLSPEVSSRLLSVTASLISSLIIFGLAYQITAQFLPSLLSFSFFLFIPFNIYYSRTILPEPMAVCCMLLSLFFFRRRLILSAVFLSFGLLPKPYIGLIMLPTLLLFGYELKYGKKYLQAILFVAITLIPFFLWRHWISQYPEGIPVFSWLLNSSAKDAFPSWFHGYDLAFLNRLVAFRPHWFHWLFVERISILILGIFGIIPVFLGLAYRRRRTQLFSFTLIFGILLYFVVVAQGNIQHDYYQVLIIPSLSFLFGFGSYYLLRFVFSNYLVGFSLFFVLIVSIYFVTLKKIMPYYHINRPDIITAGQKVAKLTPQNSLVIAPYQGDTAFLYQTHRFGWPTEVYDIPVLRQKYPAHPLYLVSVNFDDYTNSIIAHYPTLYKDNHFIILDLNHDPK